MNNNVVDEYKIKAIGRIRTPFSQKFAVPRQPGLAPSCKSYIEFYPPYSDPQAFVGLEGFTHIHVLFIFDKAPYSEFRPTVRPPRLGGNKRVGVFASRSPFRPSRIGLSVLEIERIEKVQGKIRVHVLGADLVDKTPIIDIKPYIPFVDIKEHARGGYAENKPELKEVYFADDVDTSFLTENEYNSICEILAQDPRPAYKGNEDKKDYQAILCNCDVFFVLDGQKIKVKAIKRRQDSN